VECQYNNKFASTQYRATQAGGTFTAIQVM